MTLETDLFPHLEPFMLTESARQAQISLAFGVNSPITRHLRLAGEPNLFIPHLIGALINYGELPAGTPALWTLMLSIREQVGIDRQAQIDALKTAIYGRSQAALWEAGAKIGRDQRYTLVQPLGEGGNGLVWLAEQILPDGLTRPVAIKALKADISRKPERVERFRSEMSLMARIGQSEKHLVEIYDVDRHAGHEYSVMRLMKGGTLREVIQGRVFSLDDARFWLEQVGIALDHVHQRGLIHRDVKPENMLLGEDRRMLFLSDFGLAISPEHEDRLTSDGKPAGTGRYMAPEQWRKENLTVRADLYALGILAYELLTGHLPYDPSQGDLVLGNAHCNEPLPANKHLTDAIYRVLSRMTAKRPEDRYVSAREFLNALLQADTDPDTENLDRLIAHYLDHLERSIDDEVRNYVALIGQHRRLEAPSPPEAPKFGSRRRRTADPRQPMKADYVPLEGEHTQGDVCDLLRRVERGGVLLGEPGTGKSWTLGRLVFDYADAWRDAPPDTRARCLIPVLVALNQFNGTREREGQKAQTLHFKDFVVGKLDVLEPYFPRLLREGRLILLCDALNEMPRQSPLDGRDLVAEVRDYLRDKPHFIVSCRVGDYTLRPDLDSLKPLEQIRVREFDLYQIRQAIQGRMGREAGEEMWRVLGGNDLLFDFLKALEAKGKAEAFWNAQLENSWNYDWEQRQAWQAMHSGARLIPLARNPFMLGVMGDIYQERGGIPASRGKLFEEFVEILLEREESLAIQRGEGFPPHDEIIGFLVELARAMQERRTTTLPYAEAAALAEDGQAQRLLIAAQSASILTDDGASYKFAHQLLQEYFAAKILLEAMEADEKAGNHAQAIDLFGETWWDAGVWKETTVILGEFLGEGAVGPNRVARWLAPATPEVALEVITRNAGGLTVADVSAETRDGLVKNALRFGDLARAKETDPRGRAAAWRVLGSLRADTRPGVLDFHWGEDYWCRVPAGEFQMGSDQDSDNRRRMERIDYDFWIAKYPVTYAQFQWFIDAPDGYRNPDWWKGLAMPEGHNREPGDQAFKVWNHPRERVSWYEYEIRLPLETEWEKAASWDTKAGEARVYPWGDTFDATKANILEGERIGQTTAVGIYPQGVALCGALDMSGNVWEWCLNEYKGGQVNMRSAAARGLRGGSWDDYQVFARAAYRSDWDPGIQDSSRGFRLVVGRPVS